MDYSGTAPIGGRVLAFVSRLLDRAAPWVLGAVVVAASWAGTEGYLGVRSTWNGSALALIALATGVAAGLARHRLWPLFVVAAACFVALALWAPVVVASYYAGTSLRRRVEIVAYCLGACVVLAASFVVSAAVGGYRAVWASLPNTVTQLFVYIGLPLVAGLWVGARRQVLAGLRDRAERLEREQAARSAEARAEERARIAREMHDVVAHRVSLMVLHAGALEVNAPDEHTARAADLIRTTGREVLANLRDVLGVLRATPAREDTAAVPAPQPDLDELDPLVDQSRGAGIPVVARTEGPVRPLPLTVQRTAYRIVQEALTNVHKHAPGAATDVVLTYLPASLGVVVRNEPAPPGATNAAAGSDEEAAGSPLPSGGYGLVGLRERVELLGGTLTSGRSPEGGFVVTADLPAAAEERLESVATGEVQA